MEKAIVSVLGQDKVGIIASVSGKLAANSINILDITQTILQDVFSMVMLVDVSNSKLPFETLKQELADLGKELGMSIRIQHEDIFNSMHRI